MQINNSGSSAYDNYLKSMSEVKTPQYTPVDVSGYYANAAGSYQNAINAAYQNRVAQSEYKAKKIAEEYENARRQTYVNSRLDAIGNNEKAASLGLAGNAYEQPRSGYSETGRIAENVALRSDINSANRAEQNARDQIAMELIEAGYTKDIELAKWMAELAVKQAEALQEESHFAFQADVESTESKRDALGEELEKALSQEKQLETLRSGGRRGSNQKSSTGKAFVKHFENETKPRKTN